MVGESPCYSLDIINIEEQCDEIKNHRYHDIIIEEQSGQKKNDRYGMNQQKGLHTGGFIFVLH